MKNKDLFQESEELNKLYESIKSGNFDPTFLSSLKVDGVAVFSRKTYDVSLADQYYNFMNIPYDGRKWVNKYLKTKTEDSIFGKFSCGSLKTNDNFVFPGNDSLDERLREFFNVGDVILIQQYGSSFYDKALIQESRVEQILEIPYKATYIYPENRPIPNIIDFKSL